MPGAGCEPSSKAYHDVAPTGTSMGHPQAAFCVAYGYREARRLRGRANRVTRQATLDRITAMISTCYGGAGSGNRTRIFSLEGCLLPLYFNNLDVKTDAWWTRNFSIVSVPLPERASTSGKIPFLVKVLAKRSLADDESVTVSRYFVCLSRWPHHETTALWQSITFDGEEKPTALPPAEYQ